MEHFITLNARAFAHSTRTMLLSILCSDLCIWAYIFAVHKLPVVSMKLIFHAQAMKCEIKQPQFNWSFGKSVEMTQTIALSSFHHFSLLFLKNLSAKSILFKPTTKISMNIFRIVSIERFMRFINGKNFCPFKLNWRQIKAEVWIRFRRRFSLTKQSVEFQLKNQFHIWQGYLVSPRLKQTTFHSFKRIALTAVCLHTLHTPPPQHSHMREAVWAWACGKNHLINEYPLWLININFSPPLGNCHCLALLFSMHLELCVWVYRRWQIFPAKWCRPYEKSWSLNLPYTAKAVML